MIDGTSSDYWTLGVMTTAATQRKYVSEVVWLPTYIGVGALVLGSVNNSYSIDAAIILSLIASRMLLELVYRIAFGDARLHWRVGAVAFASQLILWGALWAWYAQRGAA
jgi:hypothetical protein